MIEIDLLPEELREKVKFSFADFAELFKTKLVFTVLASLFIFHLFLQLIFSLNTARLNHLHAEWRELSPKRKQLNLLMGKLRGTGKKIELIEQLITSRVLWSKKLNQISDLLIGGIWLNELSLKRQDLGAGGYSESLIIRGSAASREKEEPALIGRFIQNLKDDADFSADFTDIELGPMKKRQVAQTEVMDFILDCQFKQESAQALLR